MQKSSTTLKILFLTTNGIDRLDSSLEFVAKVIEFAEHISHISDYNYSEVHAEIILDGWAYSACGSPPNNCVMKYRINPRILSLPCVEIVEMPLLDVPKLKKFLDLAVETPSRYSIPVWDFVLPKILLNYMDPDVPCDDPKAWKFLYCSQFVLLILRFCARQGLFAIPKSKIEILDSNHINSHTCSPAHLRHILHTILSQ
jgi:hypothetical protein